MTSSTASRARGTGHAATAWAILAAILAAAAFHPRAGFGRTGPGAALSTVPGAFLESATTGLIRPRLSVAEIQALLPARGAFAFPPPYGTTGVRLTNAGDCAGGDCVDYVGYSYCEEHQQSRRSGRDADPARARPVTRRPRSVPFPVRQDGRPGRGAGAAVRPVLPLEL